MVVNKSQATLLSEESIRQAELAVLFVLLTVAVGVALQTIRRSYQSSNGFSITELLGEFHRFGATTTNKLHPGEPTDSSDALKSETSPKKNGRSITINRSRLVQSSNGTFAQYKVVSRCGEDEFVVWRRYNEFRSLNRRLRKIVKPLDEEQCLSLFPEKSGLVQYMRCSDLDPDFLTRRAAELQAYFESLFGSGPGSLASRRRALALELVSEAGSVLGVPVELRSQLVAQTKSEDEQQLEKDRRIEGFIKVGIESLDELHRHSQAVLGTNVKDMDGWSKYGTKKGVDIFLKPVGDEVYNIGQGVIQAPMHAVLQLFADPSRRSEFDDMFESESDLEVVDPTILPKVSHLPGKPELKFMTVRHSSYLAPVPFMTPRDNVSVYTAAAYEDGSVAVALRSVETPLCPVTKKYVRTHITVAGIVLKELSRETCLMTKLEAVDPGGSLPKSVVNRIGPLRAMMVHDIGKVLRDKSKWPPFLETPEDIDRFIRDTFENLKSGASSS